MKIREKSYGWRAPHLAWLTSWLVGVGCTALPSGGLSGFIGDSSRVPINGPLLLACSKECPPFPAAISLKPVAGGSTIKVSWASLPTLVLSGTPNAPLAYDTDYQVLVPASVSAPPALAFHTEPSVGATAPFSTWPNLSQPVPDSLAWLVINFTPPIAAAEANSLTLAGASGPLVAASLTVSGDPTPNAILWGPFYDPSCSAISAPHLCDGAQYTLASAEPIFGSSTTLATFSVIADPLAPVSWLDDGSFTSNDIAVALSRGISRPCLIESPTSDPNSPSLSDFSQGSTTLAGLTPDTSYSWTITCIDSAGNATAPWPVAFATNDPETLQLSEVDVDPLADWRDATGGNGVPYDSTPGPGAGTTTDQWVELVNTGPGQVDATNWEILSSDHGRPPKSFSAQTNANPTEVYSTSGSLSLGPADRLVARLLRTKKGPADGAIELRDELGLTRDEVLMGSAGVPTGKASSPVTESVSRCPDLLNGGTPTASVWQRTAATPGVMNNCGD